MIGMSDENWGPSQDQQVLDKQANRLELEKRIAAVVNDEMLNQLINDSDPYVRVGLIRGASLKEWTVAQQRFYRINHVDIFASLNTPDATPEQKVLFARLEEINKRMSEAFASILVDINNRENGQETERDANKYLQETDGKLESLLKLTKKFSIKSIVAEIAWTSKWKNQGKDIDKNPRINQLYDDLRVIVPLVPLEDKEQIDGSAKQILNQLKDPNVNAAVQHYFNLALPTTIVNEEERQREKEKVKSEERERQYAREMQDFEKHLNSHFKMYGDFDQISAYFRDTLHWYNSPVIRERITTLIQNVDGFASRLKGMSYSELLKSELDADISAVFLNFPYPETVKLFKKAAVEYKNKLLIQKAYAESEEKIGRSSSLEELLDSCKEYRRHIFNLSRMVDEMQDNMQAFLEYEALPPLERRKKWMRYNNSESQYAKKAEDLFNKWMENERNKELQERPAHAAELKQWMITHIEDSLRKRLEDLTKKGSYVDSILQDDALALIERVVPPLIQDLETFIDTNLFLELHSKNIQVLEEQLGESRYYNYEKQFDSKPTVVSGIPELEQFFKTLNQKINSITRAMENLNDFGSELQKEQEGKEHLLAVPRHPRISSNLERDMPRFWFDQIILVLTQKLRKDDAHPTYLERVFGLDKEYLERGLVEAKGYLTKIMGYSEEQVDKAAAEMFLSPIDNAWKKITPFFHTESGEPKFFDFDNYGLSDLSQYSIKSGEGHSMGEENSWKDKDLKVRIQTLDNWLDHATVSIDLVRDYSRRPDTEEVLQALLIGKQNSVENHILVPLRQLLSADQIDELKREFPKIDSPYWLRMKVAGMISRGNEKDGLLKDVYAYTEKVTADKDKIAKILTELQIDAEKLILHDWTNIIYNIIKARFNSRKETAYMFSAKSQFYPLENALTPEQLDQIVQKYQAS